MFSVTEAAHWLDALFARWRTAYHAKGLKAPGTPIGGLNGVRRQLVEGISHLRGHAGPDLYRLAVAEPGAAAACHLAVPLDLLTRDYLVVGDDDAPPVLAEVLDRSPTGELRLRLLPGRPDSHPEFRTRRVPTGV